MDTKKKSQIRNILTKYKKKSSLDLQNDILLKTKNQNLNINTNSINNNDKNIDINKLKQSNEESE